MERDEFLALVGQLVKSDDPAVRGLGQCMRNVFGKREELPCHLLDEVDAISRAVELHFPRPFVVRYNAYQEAEEALAALADSDDLGYAVALKGAADKLILLWKLVLNFLPFLFVGAIERMRNETLVQVAEAELQEVFQTYRTMFHENATLNEGEQVTFVLLLLKLFRKLDRHGALGESFILHPLLKEQGGFDAVFPEAFGSMLRLIHQFRNKSFHAFISERRRDEVAPVNTIMACVCLYVVKCLLGIFERYGLYWVIGINAPSSDPVVTTLSFAGAASKEKRFKLTRTPCADSERLALNDLYLIDNSKVIAMGAAQPAEPIGPTDYLCLSPFVIYTMESLGKEVLVDAAPADRFRDICVLQRYNEVKQFFQYLALTGQVEFCLSSDVCCRHFFEKYNLFFKNMEGLFAQAGDGPAPEAATAGPDLVSSFIERLRKRTWQVSCNHLTALLRVQDYNERGNPVVERPSLGFQYKYNPELFVFPEEGRFYDGFYESEKRAIAFVGGSGIGKSSLLCHLFLSERRADRLAVFLDARRFRSARLDELLEESIIVRTRRDLRMENADRLLGEAGVRLVVFIDAVNEFGGPGGPLKLIQEIMDAARDRSELVNVKFVFSCRVETWEQYRKSVNNPTELLEDSVFVGQEGEAVRINGFESETLRATLFDRYARCFHLSPATYEEQGEALKELICSPFMMRMIAEIYANTLEDGATHRKRNRRKIPKKINYFKLFSLLTPRKMKDARRLFPEKGVTHDLLERQFDDCLYVFAELIYRQLIASGETSPLAISGERRDSVRIDELSRDPAFGEFMKASGAGADISIFEALTQVGLIESVDLPELNRHGVVKFGRAYKFFHDQYTQYWLSAVYRRSDILGQPSPRKLGRDPELLRTTVANIRNLIACSRDAMVLGGALGHWLYSIMSDGGQGIKDHLFPLFNAMAAGSSHVRYMTGMFLHGLPEKGVVKSRNWYPRLCRKGSFDLRKLLAEHVVYLWPNIAPGDFQALIESLDREDDDVLLRGLGDFLAIRFRSEPEMVLEFLDGILPSLKTVYSSTWLLPFNSKKDIYFQVIAKFAVKTALDCCVDREKMRLLKNLLTRKYRLVFSACLDEEPIMFKWVVRNWVFSLLDKVGLNQWDQAIGPQGNNCFFVEFDGLRQRDVLYDFYPFCVHLCNGEFDRLSLEPGSEFREACLYLIDYRPRSVVGYVATVALAAVLHRDDRQMKSVVNELLARKSDAAFFFCNYLLTALGHLKPERCALLLPIMKKDFIPALVSEDQEGESYLGFLFMTAADMKGLWPDAKIILDELTEQLEEMNPEELFSFAKALRSLCFYSEPQMGETIATHLAKHYLTNGSDNRREFAKRVLAGMLVRDPQMLSTILNCTPNGRDLEDEVRAFVDDDVLRLKDQVSYQSAWNKVFLTAVTDNPKVMHYAFRVLLAGLVQSNSVTEFSREFRRFVVELVRGYLTDAGLDRQKTFTVKEALSETLVEARYGVDGEPWADVEDRVIK